MSEQSPTLSEWPKIAFYGTVLGASAVAILLTPTSERPQPTQEHDIAGCLVPSSDALETAQSMLERPEEVMQHRYEIGISGKGPETANAISAEQYQVWRESKAATLGLTVHNFSTPEQLAIGDDPNKATKATRSFLGKYGIHLSFGDQKSEFAGIDGQPLSQEQRQSKKLARNLMTLNRLLSNYPVQFMNRIGLRKVVIMEGEVTDVGDVVDRKVAGEVNPTKQPGTIFLDYEYAVATDHEIAHLVDEAMGCLGTEDMTTLDTNGRDIYGEPTTSTTMSLERFQEETGINPHVARDARNEFKTKKEQVATLSTYGITNRDEDIAEINKDVQRGFFGRYIDGWAPVLDKKFINQLARYYMLDPVTTEFISITSYHGDPHGIEGIE